MNKVIRFLKQIKSKSKIITISFFGVVGISTIILTSVNFTGISIITAAGSSSIFPLMNAMANVYSEVERSTEIMVESGGSGAGLTAASRLSKDIGNVTGTITTKKVGAPATSTQPAIEDGAWVNWEANEMKTITIGWDAIGIVYKPLNDGVQLDINESNILKLFETFTGYKTHKMSELTNNVADDVSASGQSDILTPFSRTGGYEASGTASNFSKNTNLNPNTPPEIEEILRTGAYLNNVVATPESNVEAWKQFSLSGKDNTMIYLSSYFILANEQFIRDSGFKIATYNGVELAKQNITQTYNWFTSANAIVSTKGIQNANTPLKRFIEWIIVDETLSQKIPHWIRLTPAQINSMKNAAGEFWVSDYALIREIDDQNRGYGAIV